MFNERINNILLNQKQNNLYRKPCLIEKRADKYLYISGKKILNFSSNDYLGLGSYKKLRKKIQNNFNKYYATSSSSRVVCGNYTLINKAELAIAKYFNFENALFFPSGYQANLGIVSALFKESDQIIFDKHIHASNVKGIGLSKARFCGYNHNSIDHLRKRLKQTNNKYTAVLTESIFSMDGDLLDISNFSHLKDEYKFFSIIDEAHAFGVLGEQGKGIASKVADISVGTMGKALGFFGAFVLLNNNLKEFMLNFSSPQIYTTALPEAHAASVFDILETIEQSNQKRKDLLEISKILKYRLIKNGFIVKGAAHILSIEIGDEAKALAITKYLLNNNLFVFSARFPTVPLGKAILRLSMSALHTEKDIELLIENLKNFKLSR